MTAELIHRLHFAFTITFHYLFPQLTMGLSLLIVILKTVALRSGDEQWNRAAHFWGRIFGGDDDKKDENNPSQNPPPKPPQE